MSKVKLIHADCVTAMRRIPSGSIDLTVTSPPYDQLRNYKESLVWDASVWEAALTKLYRITKAGGVVVWVVGDATIKGSETGTSFTQALFAKRLGFHLHDTMIYQKNSMPKNHNRYEQSFEYMFVLTKGKPKTFNAIRVLCKYPETTREGAYGNHKEKGKATRSGKKRLPVGVDKIKGNIWHYAVGKNHSTNDDIAFTHPAIFPEQLARDHILSWSNVGDTVLDPFMGSGTTGKVAYEEGRHFIGIDSVKEYVDLSRERIKLAQ